MVAWSRLPINSIFALNVIKSLPKKRSISITTEFVTNAIVSRLKRESARLEFKIMSNAITNSHCFFYPQNNLLEFCMELTNMEIIAVRTCSSMVRAVNNFYINCCSSCGFDSHQVRSRAHINKKAIHLSLGLYGFFTCILIHIYS